MGHTCQECLQVFAIVERLASASAMNIAGQCHAPMCPFLQLSRGPVVWAWEEKPFDLRERQVCPQHKHSHV